MKDESEVLKDEKDVIIKLLLGFITMVEMIWVVL
jgi:hypothetical protein